MEIKVKKATGSNSRTTSMISLTDDLDLSEQVKNRIKNDVGDFLVEQILKSVRNEESPIAGAPWPELSDEYKKKKKAEVGNTDANMELEGHMLDALSFETTDDGIEIGFMGKQAAKADGHNNFSGDSQIPTRQFLPDVGDEFAAPIQNEIEKIIGDAIADNMEFNRKDFEDVDTRAELKDLLEDFFPGFSRAEIKSVVARTPVLFEVLDDLDLLEWL